MSKKLLSVTVKGNQSKWNFNFYGDPNHIQDWVNDGLEIVEIENVIPKWVVDIGLLKPYVFLQDIFNFKNPLKK